MITRKLGKLVRGKATPFQLMAASILGALLGFAPGITQAPALYALLVGALLVVNANLGFALLVAAGTRLLSFACVAVSFQVGRFLLDGPVAGLAEAVVNAPVLAWCGLEYYAVAGGQVLGLFVGIAIGLVVTRALTGFRRRMMAAQGDETRLRQIAAKPWAKVAIWLFFGGKGKESWEQKLTKRVGNPVRIWGAALVVLLVAGAFFLQRTLAGPLARAGLRSGLESANGATVDVGGVELDLAGGKLAVSSLAMADPNELARDLFRADLLEADVDEGDFLRKRLHVGRLVVSGARSGAPRDEPGERIAPPVEEPEEKAERTFPDPSDYSLEEVLAEYETWKERLTQTRRWIDRLAGDRTGKDEASEETLSDRLARQVAEQGWFGVRADHLVDGAPTFRLSELTVGDFQTTYSPGRSFDLHATELSTDPHLVDAPPRAELASRDGAIGLVVDLAPVSRAGGDGALRFHWKDLAVDDVMAQLRLPGKTTTPFRGGTLDVEIDGAWDQGRIGHVDLPLKVTLHDTTFQMQGIEPTALERLELPIGLKGPIDAPRIHFDASALTDALVAAGKEKLAREVRGLVDEKVEELQEELKGELQEGLQDELQKKLPDAKGALKGILGKG